MKKQEKQVSHKPSYRIVILIILLLLTIAFLVWLLLRPQSGAKRTPTGNVDTFNININCSCGPSKTGDGDDDCDKDGDGKQDDSVISYYGSITDRQITANSDDGIIVFAEDADGKYSYERSLRIFENVAFEYTNKIAPGVSNSYDFRVRNITVTPINYNVSFEENSEYAINLRYRLKRNGIYIIGDEDNWVSASELASAMTYLSGNAKDEYTLDWEWPYEGGTDAADTEAGEEMTSEYTLGIKIVFEEA